MIEMKVTGISEALKKVEALKKSLPDKLKEVCERLMQEGFDVASALFSEAIYEGTNDVIVDPPVWEDDRIVLYARGEAVAFIEFGTGTIATPYPPLPTGDDPYAKLGMSQRGEYGHKHGKEPPWYYPLEKGLGNKGRPKRIGDQKYSTKWAIAYGNPPARAMYQATVTISDQERILEIATEVFNK